MSKLIYEMLTKRMTDKKTKLLIASVSYYSILALIPTFLLTRLILDFFNVPLHIKYQDFFDIISLNLLSGFFITVAIIYMISRIFFVILKDRFSVMKSFVFSVIFSLFLIVFLSIFITTYTITNPLFSTLIRYLLILIFFFLLIRFTSNSNLKYSTIFSVVFSIIVNVFIYAFFYMATFFINYENYYGILAPLFLVILAIHLFIYITCFAYIGAEEFTKISKIKFVKC